MVGFGSRCAVLGSPLSKLTPSKLTGTGSKSPNSKGIGFKSPKGKGTACKSPNCKGTPKSKGPPKSPTNVPVNEETESDLHPNNVGINEFAVDGTENDTGGGLSDGSESVPPPCVGMLFDCWEDVEVYYKQYGKQVGFGISRVAAVKSKDKKARISMTWRCECWGDPQMRFKRLCRKRAREMEVGGSNVVDDVSMKKNKSKKCHCPAMLYAHINSNGKWQINKLVLEHENHVPHPSKSKLVKEYRMQNFNGRARRRLLNDIEVGVPISKIHDAIANERDGLDNMPFLAQDMRQVVADERRLKMVGGDANALMDYFDKMRRENLDFFYSHRMDDSGRLKDVFWADARSRAAYEEFGDVVCFDSTYLTNEYDLPFANFVGVNHHGQSTLFGCALISSEDCDTFRWVFSQWLLCMKGKAPDAILTDQAAAMRRPLEEVMPNTRHRWCIWHILQKFPRRYGKEERYDELKEELFQCIYNSVSVDEFDNSWPEVIKKYKLEGDDWLGNLFEERFMWVPACMKGHFWAGMRTTQRVESINSYFDKFIFRHTRLCEFGQRYCAALKRRVAQEEQADADDAKWCRHTTHLGYSYEKVFREVYTDAKFRLVQRQFERVTHCIVRHEKEESSNKYVFVVEDRVWIMPKGFEEEFVTDRRRMYRVLFDSVTKDACCDCSMFESQGIMCRHVIRVLDQNYVEKLPDQYIVRRWRKDVVRKHSKISVSQPDHNKRSKIKRRDKINVVFDPLVDVADSYDATTDIVVKGLVKLKEEVLRWVKQNSNGEERATIEGSFSCEGRGSGQQSCDNNGTSEFGDNIATQSSFVDVATMGTPVSTSRANVKDPAIPKRGPGRPKSNRFKAVGEPGWEKANYPGKSKGKKKGGRTIQKGKNNGDSAKQKATKSTPNATVSVADGQIGVCGERSEVNAEPLSKAKLKVKRRKKVVAFTTATADDGSYMETQDDFLLTSNGLTFSQPKD